MFNLGLLALTLHLHLLLHPPSLVRALPASSPQISNDSSHHLTLNVSAPTKPSNELTIAQNIDRLLTTINSSPDHTLSTAALVSVTLRPTFAIASTPNVNQLRWLTLTFYPSTPPPHPGRRSIISISNSLTNFARWTRPIRYTVSEESWRLQTEIQWGEVMALMGFEEAARRVRAAGFEQEFFGLEVARWRGSELAWCFSIRGVGGVGAVRVGVLSGRVEEDEDEGC
ncbi:MAG: hypothetical protein Q9166_002868 [cf. Caloplaca sp. 2 TL-2023]